MSNETTEKKSSLVELAQAIGAVLGAPIALFSIINNIFQQPIVSLVIAISTGIGLSIWLASSRKMNYAYLAIAWLALFVIILLGFVIWPNTMTLEGFVTDVNGKPIANETVNFFDYRGQIYETQTDQDGFYQFVDVPTGKYKIHVRATEIQGESKGLLVRVVSQSISVSSESTDASTPTPTNTAIPQEITNTPTATPQEITGTPTPTPTDTVTPQEVTDTPTFTPKPTNTPTLEPTNTPTLKPTNTSTPKNVFVEGNVLFEDNFETGNASQWFLDFGAWSVIDDGTGNLVLEAKATKYTEAKTASFDWSDYAFEAKVYVAEFGTAEYGETFSPLFYISGDCDNFKRYKWIINQESTNLIRSGLPDCDSWKQFGGGKHKLPLGSWITIRVEVVDNMVRGYIDGQELLNIIDDESLPEGGIGFMVTTNSNTSDSLLNLPSTSGKTL